jgi:hypothetical protein
VGGAGQGSSLVGVLESCADSHDCGCVGVVGGGGLLEYYASGVVCCICWCERERVVGLVRLCFERRRAALESGSQVVLYESCVTEFSFAVR